MRVCLVPLGGSRVALYAEPPAVAEPPPAPDASRLRHWLHRAGVEWRRLMVDARARVLDGSTASGATARLRRWFDRLVCRLADTIDDQRALWSLRGMTDATLLYASSLTTAEATAKLHAVLGTLRRHHGRWMVADLLLFIVTGALFLLPGPNVIAYYFGIRAFGHLQSWRGARQARTDMHWTLEASDPIAELAALAEWPRAARAAGVEAVAARLDLPGLASFVARNAH